METSSPGAFAIWVTGLPASGKSTIVASLKAHLLKRGVDVAVLESDVLRKIFTPQPRYDEQEREMFYKQMVFVGTLLTSHGVPVIFDATANRRSYRDAARAEIPNFLEVYVECPLQVCISRDPKGIYRKGREGASDAVPGTQVAYEPPTNPEVSLRGDSDDPEAAAQRIIERLQEKRYL